MNSSMKESECILPPIHSVRRCGRTFHCSFLFLVALLFMGSRTAFNAVFYLNMPYLLGVYRLNMNHLLLSLALFLYLWVIHCHKFCWVCFINDGGRLSMCPQSVTPVPSLLSDSFNQAKVYVTGAKLFINHKTSTHSRAKIKRSFNFYF